MLTKLKERLKYRTSRPNKESIRSSNKLNAAARLDAKDEKLLTETIIIIIIITDMVQVSPRLARLCIT
jgi:hypothetical protein